MMGRRSDGIRYRSARGRRTVLLEQIKLILTLFLTGGILIALETTVCSRIPLPMPVLGVCYASPALGLLLSMAVGFLYGEEEGGITGLVAGWLSDAVSIGASVGSMMVLPLLYFLCGYLSGAVGKRRLAHNLPSFMVFAVVGGGIKCLFTVGLAALELRSPPPILWVWRGLVPAWLLTILCSVAVYGIVYGERKLLEPK